MTVTRAGIEEEAGAVRLLARKLGLGPVTPILLKAAHHSSFRVSPLLIVARVQSSAPQRRAFETAARELAVARHLTGRRAPVVPPLGTETAGPHVIGPCIITLWSWIDQSPAPQIGQAEAAATALRAVHPALSSFGGALPQLREKLQGCGDALADPLALPGLASDDRAFLGTRFRQLLARLDACDATSVRLHGDAHPGNVLWTDEGPLWLDFEAACAGPLEWDIGALPCGAWPLFPGADASLLDLFTDLRSACVAVWCSAELSRSAEIRAAADYHLGRLRTRGGES